MPALTLFFAASLRLKSMWLPRMQRNVQLPKNSRMYPVTNDEPTMSVATAKDETHMALENISVMVVSKSGNDKTDRPKYSIWSLIRTKTSCDPFSPFRFQCSVTLNRARHRSKTPNAIGNDLLRHYWGYLVRLHELALPNHGLRELD